MMARCSNWFVYYAVIHEISHISSEGDNRPDREFYD